MSVYHTVKKKDGKKERHWQDEQLSCQVGLVSLNDITGLDSLLKCTGVCILSARIDTAAVKWWTPSNQVISN